MKEVIALVPGLIAAWFAFRKSAQAAFLNAYLPALILLPDYYYWNAPGLPDPSFVEAAIIPVAIAFFLRDAARWRFSATDVLVSAFAFCVGYSEYLNAGYKEAQNLLFDCVSGVFLPYVLAKGLIEPQRLRADVAKRMVLLFFLVGVGSAYEFRFGRNPYRDVFDSFFPGQGRGWVVSIRWGFGRIAGPYGHAILAGVMLAAGFRLARWTQWADLWPKRLRRLPWQPISPGAALSLGTLAGLVMTLCRGPWLGAILAAVITSIGRARNRWRALTLVVGGVVLIGGPAVLAFKSYVAVGRKGAESATQETAAYRFELLQNYLEIVSQKPVFGWGRNTWPKVPGQPSIDNHYLLLLLMHGYSATLLLLSLLLWVGGRLFLHGMREPPAQPPGSSFTFTLLGILCAIYLAIATVFMGLNTQPLLFVMLGWAEGYLLVGSGYQLGAATVPPVAPPPPFRFKRVLT